MAPKLATASISSPLACALHTSAIASTGFSTPVLVSQCTTKTWVMAGSARIAASNCAAVGGTKGWVRMAAYGTPAWAQISISRSPYTPLVWISSLPPGGTSPAITASLA